MSAQIETVLPVKQEVKGGVRNEGVSCRGRRGRQCQSIAKGGLSGGTCRVRGSVMSGQVRELSSEQQDALEKVTPHS